MKIAQNISDLIGNTPIVALHNIEKEFALKAQLVAKLEYLNPAGSAKDRIAKAMIEEAFADGRLNKNSVIIEPTSGNTGIGLAAVAASYGLKVILTMPETMSIERRNLLKAYGAELVLTEGSLGMAGAVKKAEEIAAATKDSFIAGQFDNPVNPKAHEQTTGPEIWRDTDGKVAAFVAGIGTGGTLSGTGRFLKAQNKNIRIIGVEPASSPLLTQNRAGAHKIQGIGANFVPANLDRSVYDEVMPVTDEDAIETARMLAKKEGFLTGISSGAALFAAMQLAKKEEFKDRIIVALLPDTGDRYLSVLN